MSFDAWWLTYLALGAFVGFFAGLLGIGGGGIMVPMLTTLFLAQGFPLEHVVHLSLGTSMAAIVLTSISSLRAHHAHGAVHWNIVRAITPGILVGTFGATFLAARASTEGLAIFFACFMAYVSLQMLANVKPKPSRGLPGPLGMGAVGVGIGGISALVAIGGGSLSVPFMTWCNVKMQEAIGTSAAIGLPIALAGALGYLINGWGASGLPPFSLGYVYLPALVLVSLVSMWTAPVGARLAHRLPVAILKKIFAGVLMLLCLKMLHGIFFS
ncbi:sulfite exporter TauE/SafE family protein [Pseudothauera nasutitermitis]|uniref:Probable membrane transporter protein n=1 Tax=Pseudothauera nasutitermitis TaxID=2565930 RepID=A0A4S4AXF7_9RHOO|nr:sulfite exporter TauE/SafE family protein [Pseudothauera nasutitermitis]THF63985.1 sulfite exporter TauE/SafE family protein [Pseudothauera nasutitermitis]